MTDLSRREMLGLLGMAVMSGAFGCTADGVEKAAREVRKAAVPFTPKFFTDPELKTVRTLVDIVIPKDERSGSATDAGVPEFMDYLLGEFPDSGEKLRKGLVWLDAESVRRFGTAIAESAPADQLTVIDAIAWPKRAVPEVKDGVDFFKNFRNLTASGFWSSRMGIEDLQYIGNTFNPNWNGCPEAALTKLGVSYG